MAGQGLSKVTRTPRLLRTVKGQKYADNDDHEEEEASLPKSEDSADFLRSPESSEDEMPSKTVSLTKTPSLSDGTSGRNSIRSQTERPPIRKRMSSESDAMEPDFMTIGWGKKDRSGSKITSTASTHKKQKLTSRETTYAGRRDREKAAQKLEKEKQAEAKRKEKDKAREMTTFQKLEGVDLEQIKFLEPSFQQLEGVAIQKPEFISQAGSTSGLSFSSTPIDLGLDDTGTIDVSDGADEDLANRCEHCRGEVDSMAKENFQIEHSLGKRWTFKWQARFCDYHKRLDGEKLWKEKGYPEIDWKKLPGRLRTAKRTARMRDILSGKQRSSFQADQEEAVRGRKQTAQQYLLAETEEHEKGRSRAGYYGYRGEKVIVDHIMQKFGEDLRARSTKDVVVAASGFGGGMAGFVSAILVPEMAASLVAEDLDYTQDEAVKVVKNSSELGDLLYPEQEDSTRIEVIKVED